MNSDEDCNNPWVSLCENCCQPLKAKSKTTITVLECKGFDADEDEVQVIDAISYIYGISWNEFLSYSKNGSEPFLERKEISINLCESCVLLLTQNYTAHKNFENVSHPSSIIRQINSFRLKAIDHSETDKKIDERGDLIYDNDYHDDEELVDSFNFEDEYKDREEVEIEEKCNLTDNEDLPQNPVSTVEDNLSKSNCETRTTRNSLKLRQQVVVKLERISMENLNDPDVNKREKKNPAYRKKVAPTKQRKISLKGREKKRKICRAKMNADIFDGSVSGANRGRINRKSAITKRFNVKCKVCGKGFINRHYYKISHLPKHYGQVWQKKCNICGKVLTSLLGFTNHMTVFHGDEEEKRKLKSTCEICGVVMNSYWLKYHMEQHSSSREIYKCDKCGKEYLNKQTFAEHVLTHSEKFVPHLCMQCGKTFKTKSSLAEHEKSHTEEKKYSCDSCSLKFRSPIELKYHLQSHSTERKYVCDECGKTFKYKSHLNIHLKIHKEIAEKGEMNVKCEECGKFFKHSLSLYKHTLRFHRRAPDWKKKVYKCSFCGKILCSQTNLTVHENLHKNNPEYKPRKKQTWKNKINSQTSFTADPDLRI